MQWETLRKDLLKNLDVEAVQDENYTKYIKYEVEE